VNRVNGEKGFYSKDDIAQGATEFTVLLVLAAPLPMLGVSAGLGSIAFSLRGFAGPGGLQRRTEVAPYAGFFLVMWNSLDDLIMVPGPVTSYLVGMVLPLGVLAAAVSAGCGRSPRGVGGLH